MRNCELDNDAITCPWCNRKARTRDTRRNCRASRGLGDTVAWLIGKVWKKKCKPCKGRQEKLNELVPYG
jgi:hypothetical protein